MQLDLLTYKLTEQELSPIEPPPPSDRLTEWLYGCLSFHRQLQIRVMDKGIKEKLKASPNPTRLAVLKEMVGRSQNEADKLLQRIKQLEGGDRHE